VSFRKPWWWWDGSWNPVTGCRAVSDGCRDCIGELWMDSHTHKRKTVDYGVTKKEHGRRKWNGEINALRAGHHLWNGPLTWPGVENPALGPGQPSLIFVVFKGDLFYTKRVKEDIASINRVCATIAASKHIGLLVIKYTEEMATYFAALDPRTARRWQSKLWLCFSAENQYWFDKRWADIRPLAEAGWFVFTSLASLIDLVTLPDDFLALAKWVIVNGEKAKRNRVRLMKTAWVRAIHDQCTAAHIPLFIKGPHTGGYLAPDLQKIRQFPKIIRG
jgi:protein gp37